MQQDYTKIEEEFSERCLLFIAEVKSQKIDNIHLMHGRDAVLSICLDFLREDSWQFIKAKLDEAYQRGYEQGGFDKEPDNK